MANGEVEVGIVTETSGLDQGLRSTFENIQNIVKSAETLNATFANSAKSLAPTIAELTKVRVELMKASTDAEKLRLGDIKKGLDSTYLEAASKVRELRDSLRAAALDQANVRQKIAQSPTGDGRTFGQAKTTNEIVQAQITAINTTTEQVAVRLAEAMGKAFERTIKNTQAAMEARAANTEATELSRQIRFNTPGYSESLSNKARVAAQQSIRSNIYETIEDRDAAQRADRNAKYLADVRRRSEQAIIDQRVADRQKEERDAARAASAPERLQQRVDSTNEFRNALLNANGGLDFFAFQARLSAQYQLIGSIQGAIVGTATAVIEFDDVLKRFQAVTQTANVEMAGFREGLLGIASNSRFSVTELSEVSITLAQTGLSAKDALKALPAVVNLATAAGSTLPKAVETITSVMGAFNIQASRSGEIADVLVGALNRTRLTMEQLSVGIGYASNIAHESGVSYSELIAVMGSLSQAGIKSGSTLGTGVRQLIQELVSPTDKLRSTMGNLGVSFADIDLKSNGLVGVLENLQNKGFTTADALRTLDLRAASAFAAMAGGLEKTKQLQIELLLTSSATEGAAKANESLAASFTRLKNSAFALADGFFKPVVDGLKAEVEELTRILNLLDRLSKIGTLTPIEVTPGEGERLDRLKGAANSLSSRRGGIETNIRQIDESITNLYNQEGKLNADPLARQAAVLLAQKQFGEIGLSVDYTTTSIKDLIGALQVLRGQMQSKLPDIGLSEILNAREQARLAALQADVATRSPLPFSAKAVTGLGPQFGAVLSAMTDPKVLGIGDASAKAAPLFALLNDRIAKNTTESANLEVSGSNPFRLDQLKQEADLLDKINKRLAEMVSLRKNVQGVNLKVESTAQTTNIDRLQSSSSYQELLSQLQALQGAYKAETIANQNDKGISGTQRWDKQVVLARGMAGRADVITKQLDTIVSDMSQDGVTSREALEEAYKPLRLAIQAISKGVTKEIEDLAKSVSKEATGEQLARQSANQAAIKTLMGEAGKAHDQERVAAIKAEVENLVAQQKEIAKKILELSPGNLGGIESNPEIMAKLAEQRRELDEQMTGYAQRLSEAAKRIAREALTIQENAANKRAASLKADIDQLEKRLKNPMTTTEEADLLVKRLEELRKQFLGAILTGYDIKAAKDSINAPTPTPDPSMNNTLGPKGDSTNFKVTNGSNMNVDEKLVELIRLAAAEQSKYLVEIVSGRRGPDGVLGTSSLHNQSKALDVQLVDKETGKRPGFYQNGEDFREYELFAQIVRKLQLQKYPELTDTLAWGGYFGGPKGKYGALDSMHFSLGERMGGGSWTGGLTPEQRALWPTARSQGMAPDVAEATAAAKQKASTEVDTANETSRKERDNIARRNDLAVIQWEKLELDRQMAQDQLRGGKDATSEQVSTSNRRVIDDVVRDFGLQMRKEALSKDGRTPQEQANAEAQIRAGFSATGGQQAQANAEAAGKAVLRGYDREIDTIQDKIKTLSLPSNLGKYDAEIDSLKEQLRLKQLAKETDGEEAASVAKREELERSLKQLQASGLGTGEAALKIEEGITAEKVKQKRLTESSDFRRSTAARGFGFGEAAKTGIYSFEKSRGIRDVAGNMLSETQTYAKMISDSLIVTANAFDQLFTGLATKSKKTKELFADFAKSVLSGLASMASKAVTSEIFRLLLGGGDQKSDTSPGLISTAISAAVSAFTGAPGKALGGEVPNLGMPTRDSVPIMATPGEFVLRRSAVDMIGKDRLMNLNSMGGSIIDQGRPQSIQERSSPSLTSNVYVLAPEEKPSLSPNDVLFIINSDIRRGGATKQLIKQVQAG